MQRTSGTCAIAIALLVGAGLSSGPALGASTSKSNADNQTFVRKATIGGMTEIQLSQLARTRSSNDQVRQFADLMITDHQQAGDKLDKIARQDGWQVPTALDAKEQKALDALKTRSGTEFDRAYAAKMKHDHVLAVALFKREAASGKSADLKAFASETLPTLEEHLKKA
ncbi:MAG: DUF4142 domain-containing protein, partial [Rhodanobacteraceae bacterium]